MTDPIPVGGGAAGGDRRRLFILLGIGGGLLLLALFSGVLFGGGDPVTIDDDPVVPRPDGRPSVDEPSDDDGAPAETFEVFSTKNPFQPPIALGPAPSAPAGNGSDGGPSGGSSGTVGGGGTTGGGTSGGGTTGGGNAGTTATTAPSGTASGGASAPARQQQRVTLVDTFVDGGAEQATVRVNDTVHTVGEGDTFGGSYQLVVINGECGDFLFGDSPFTLCVGEETLK